MSYVSRIYVGTITHVAEMENPVGMAGQSCKTNEQRGQGGKKPSRKLDGTCISRIYVTTSGQHGKVKVVYLPAHTNHSLSIEGISLCHGALKVRFWTSCNGEFQWIG